MANDLLNVVRYGWDQLEQEEGTLDSATVTPGHLLERTASGWQEHSVDGDVVDRVVVAKDMRGRGFEVDPTETYPDGEFITLVKPGAGVGLTMLLDTGEDLSGAYPDGEVRLVSSGNGTLRQFSGDDPDDVVAVIEEGADATGLSDPLPVDVEVTR